MVKAAVIGLGNHGLRHIEAIKKLNNIQVSSICDKNDKNFKLVSNEIDGINFYNNDKDLFENENLDLVAVVTNGPSHAPIIKRGIESGIRKIFCEKPLCTSVHDAKKITELCRKTKTRLEMGYIRRFSEDYINLVKSIDAGVIGIPRHYHITVGSGLFAAVGAHYLDLFRMITKSEPIKVYGELGDLARVNPRGNEFQDPGAFATFLFEDGSRCIIDIMEDLGVPPKIEIIGSIGRIIIHGDEEKGAKWTLFKRPDSLKSKSLRRYDIDLEEIEIKHKHLDIIDLLVSGYKSLLSNNLEMANIDGGYKGVEMLLATHISSIEKKIISFPLSSKNEKFSVPFT